MKRRAVKFILALTALSAIVWFAGELLIGAFINSYAISVIWGIVCLVGCCAYSLWKCPREPEPDDEDDEEE